VLGCMGIALSILMMKFHRILLLSSVLISICLPLFAAGQLTCEQLMTAPTSLKFGGHELDRVVDLDSEHPLAKANRVLSKRDSNLYLIASIGLGTGVEGKSSMISGKLAVIMPEELRNIEIAENYAGQIAHELTHNANDVRAARGTALGFVRTLRLQSLDPNMKLMNGHASRGVKGYDQMCRVDEIHARAVEAGVDISRAKDAIKAGDLARAKTLLETAAGRINDKNTMVARFDVLLNQLLSTPLNQLQAGLLENNELAIRLVRRGYSPELRKQFLEIVEANPNANPATLPAPDIDTAFYVIFKVPARTTAWDIPEIMKQKVEYAMREYHRFDKSTQLQSAAFSALYPKVNH